MAVYSPSGFANVHIDEVLTNISLGYPNNGLVGDRLFPSVPVAKQSNKYPVFGREGWLPEDDVRAPGTEANEIPGLSLSLDTYFANEHSLQIAVTDEERENADSPLRPDADLEGPDRTRARHQEPGHDREQLRFRSVDHALRHVAVE
jgi:hypothetical protein